MHVLPLQSTRVLEGCRTVSGGGSRHEDGREQSLQAAGTCLCRFEANCVVMTRPFPSWPSTRVTRASRTVVSLSVRPGDSTFVESLMNSATPSLPASTILGPWKMYPLQASIL